MPFVQPMVSGFALGGGLIVAGLLGLGALIQANPSLAQTMRWGGALFLLGYGL